MDSELKKFVKVWVQAIIALCYCYLISSKIPQGLSRLASLLPVISLFIFLPLNLSSFHLTFVTASDLAWLANFKLLLYAFDQGPLSSPTKLLHFILIASLPIKVKPHPPPKSPQKSKNSTYPSHKKSYLKIFPGVILFVTKALLFVVIIQAYQYKEYLHDHVLTTMYCCYLYLELDFAFSILATVARSLGFEFEPHFDDPFLSTSLQNFWGYRWNLVILRILRPTVHDPVRDISTRIIGRRLAWIPSVIMVFAVSGLMHELLLCYVIRAPPTWEQLCFFVLHGVCVVVEIGIKRMVANRWRLHGAVSVPLTLAFVAATSAWLFFPIVIRNNLAEMNLSEISVAMDFIKDVVTYTLIFIRRKSFMRR